MVNGVINVLHTDDGDDGTKWLLPCNAHVLHSNEDPNMSCTDSTLENNAVDALRLEPFHQQESMQVQTGHAASSACCRKKCKTRDAAR